MKVLFVVMEFVPLNLAGVYRPLRFINGLQKAGIETTVISIEPDEQLKKIQTRFDPSLEDKLHPAVRWIKIPMDDITQFYKGKFSRFYNTYFSVSDNYASAWRKNLMQAIPGILEDTKPDIIITTCPPFSSATLTREIALKYNIPYVIDMRDAWSLLSMQPVGSYFHFLFKKYEERRCFRDASAVITVTPQLRKMLQQNHPYLQAEKFHLIYNSFSSDFQHNDIFINAKPLINNDIIHIGYSGSYYYNPVAREQMRKPWWKRKGHRIFNYIPVKEYWLYRSPYFFLKALKEMFEEDSSLKNRVIFHHIGDVPEWLKNMVLQMDLWDNVIFHGVLTSKQVDEVQNSFDYLLATSEKVIHSEHYCLPSKIFSYMQSQKPVIGFVTPGIQRDFIVNSGMGVVIDPDSETSSGKLHSLILNGFKGKLNNAFISQFDESVTNHQLIEVINKIPGGTK